MNNYIKKTLPCILLCFLCAMFTTKSIYAQSTPIIEIKGQVLDENEIALPGATIIVEGTQNGATTDFDGNFTISAPANASLDISYIGFESQQINVNNRTFIKVILKEELNALNEVVVVGYGVRNKTDLTGAVTQVKMSSFEGQQAVTVADYLRGSVAGLNISRSASTGGQTNFQIRGTTSLGTDSDPLLVVDGIIFNGRLNDINPSDIESISVLKDASSAAVFGASGASGVILITTKKGTSGKPTIRIDIKSSTSELLRREEMYSDVDDFLLMRADALRTFREDNNWTNQDYYVNPFKLNNIDYSTWLGYDSGRSVNSDPTAVWLERLQLRPNEIQNYYNFNNANWEDLVFRTGFLQDYNMSVSGKTENSSYYWSLGFLDNEGVVRNDSYKNVRSRINLTTNITDFLEIGFRGNLSVTDNDGEPADWEDAFNNTPLGTVFNPDGTYTRYPNDDTIGRNPLDPTQYDVKDQNIGLNGTMYAKLKLPYGFSFQTSYDNRWRMQQDYSYRPSYTIGGKDDFGVAERDEDKQYEWTLENMLKWNGTFGSHKFDATLMQNSYKYKSWSTTAGATGFNTSELLGYNNLELGDIQNSDSSDAVETKASYLAILNYSFKNRYFLDLSYRRDGFSGFGQDNPWGNFPSAAIGWRISEESFLKDSDWVSNLKLRASYGVNGNSNFGRYAALAQVNNNFYINDGNPVVTLYPSTLGNSSLKWEETTALNIGLEVGLWKNRLSLTIDAYKQETRNQLLDRKIPSINGFEDVPANLGQVDNQGLEVTLNSVNFDSQDFRWTTDIAFWFNRNKIRHLYGDLEDVLDDEGNVIGQKEADDPTNGWFIGRSIDEIYGYQVIGIWQEDEVQEAAQFGRIPGDYRTFALPTSTSLSSADWVWQGHREPRYSFSVRNNFAFFNKALSVSFLIRSELGHKKSISELDTGSFADRVSQIKYPYWTYENPSTEWGRLGAARTGTIYHDASFVRIDNFTVGYNFPKKAIEATKLQSLRVYLNIDNVYSFDDWLYWDPETKDPTPTTLTLGLNLTI